MLFLYYVTYYDLVLVILQVLSYFQKERRNISKNIILIPHNIYIFYVKKILYDHIQYFMCYNFHLFIKTYKFIKLHIFSLNTHSVIFKKKKKSSQIHSNMFKDINEHLKKV